MSKIVYTTDIDPEKMVSSELSTRFLDLDNFVNTTKVSQDNFRPGSINHRHIKHPLAFDLSVFAKGSAIGTLNGTFKWTALSGTVLAHSTTMEDGYNRDQLEMPLVEVVGVYNSTNFAYTDLATVGKAIGIGYSIDNGATYTVVAESIRPIGYRSTTPGQVLWGTENHYHSGAAGWLPYQQYTGKSVLTSCMFGGSVDHHRSDQVSDIDHYCLMMLGDNTAFDIHSNDRAYLLLTARDNLN